jgi:hypothetical protein
MPMHRVARRHGLLAAVALVILSGCADDTPPIGYVTGMVTRGGKPVPNLTIGFTPTEGRPSWGMTDADGRYELHWDADHDGAEVGTHKVSAAYIPGSPDEEAALAKGKRPPEELAAITKKYGNYQTTPLTIEVKDGSQVIDLALD